MAQSLPPCTPAWIAQHRPALKIDGLATRIAVDRRMDFSLVSSESLSSNYRADLPSSINITTGPSDRTPYSELFRRDVKQASFFIKAERSDLGKTYTVKATWSEDDSDFEPAAQPCLRTAIASVRVFRGFAPRIKVTNDNNNFFFEVTQRRGAFCEQTRRGSVRITVRGPDRTRAIRLRDTCGTWTQATGGRGWRLKKELNGTRNDALASLYFKFRTPGTRRFSYRVTFRGRRVASGSFEVVARFAF